MRKGLGGEFVILQPVSHTSVDHFPAWKYGSWSRYPLVNSNLGAAIELVPSYDRSQASAPLQQVCIMSFQHTTPSPDSVLPPHRKMWLVLQVACGKSRGHRVALLAVDFGRGLPPRHGPCGLVWSGRAEASPGTLSAFIPAPPASALCVSIVSECGPSLVPCIRWKWSPRSALGSGRIRPQLHDHPSSSSVLCCLVYCRIGRPRTTPLAHNSIVTFASFAFSHTHISCDQTITSFGCVLPHMP